MNKYFTFLLFGLASTQMCAQNVLSVEANAMRDSDKIAYQSMEFCTSGNLGNNESWNFSNQERLNEDYNIHYTKDTFGRIHQYIGHDKNPIY